jgi:predicted acyltransferase
MTTTSVQSTLAQVPTRLVSLDAFRGFTMFWLMGGHAFIAALAALGAPATTFITYQLDHSTWVGIRYYDLIWPSFMLMVGVSVPFSFARRSANQTRGKLMRQVWRRGIVLFLLGSLRASISGRAPVWIELSSALQPIALAYVVTAHLAGRAVRLQIAIAAGILGLYGLLLALVPAPGLPAGSYEVNRNLVTTVDQMLLGRSHPEGWGTVLSAIPTISTTIIGLLFGQVLLSARSHSQKMRVFGLTGLGCLAAGIALSPAVPVIMKLWTASYGLVSAGWACLLFLLFYWLVDVREYRKWAFPLVVIGTNALAAYLGPSLVPTRHIAGIFTGPLAREIGAFGPVLSSAVVLLINWLILHWMYRRKIFLRA